MRSICTWIQSNSHRPYKYIDTEKKKDADRCLPLRSIQNRIHHQPETEKEIAVDTIAVVTIHLIDIQLYVYACLTGTSQNKYKERQREKELCYQASRPSIHCYALFC